MPVSGGKFFNNCEMASNPPADAPIATMGKERSFLFFRIGAPFFLLEEINFRISWILELHFFQLHNKFLPRWTNEFSLYHQSKNVQKDLFELRQLGFANVIMCAIFIKQVGNVLMKRSGIYDHRKLLQLFIALYFRKALRAILPRHIQVEKKNIRKF